MEAEAASASAPPDAHDAGPVAGPSAWSDPHARDAWLRLARRRVRRRALAALVALGTSALVATAAIRLTSSSGSELSARWLLAFVLLTLLGIPIASFGLWRWIQATIVRRQVIPDVLHTGGRLCISCGRRLEAGPGGMWTCPSCQRDFDPALLERWWWIWAREGTAAACRQLPIDDPWRRPGLFDLAGNGLARRSPALRGWVVVPVMIAAIATVSRGPALLAFVEYHGVLIHMCIALGIIELWYFATTRVGCEWRCARCGYPRAPEGPHPLQCPECGLVWNAPGMLVRGRPRMRKRTAAVITLAVTALWMAWSFQALSLRQLLWRLVPTSTLIRQVTTPGADYLPPAWRALRLRPLTPQQRRELASRLMALPRKGLQHNLAERWLAEQIVRGTLSPDLTTAYFRSHLKAAIDVVGPRRVGQDSTCRLIVQWNGLFLKRSPRGGYLLPFAVLERLRLGDTDLTPQTRGLLLFANSPRDGRPSALIPWQPRHAGTARLEATVWLAVGPLPRQTQSGPVGEIRLTAWNPDGSPALPAGTIWQHRTVLSAEVDIEP